MSSRSLRRFAHFAVSADQDEGGPSERPGQRALMRLRSRAEAQSRAAGSNRAASAAQKVERTGGLPTAATPLVSAIWSFGLNVRNGARSGRADHGKIKIFGLSVQRTSINHQNTRCGSLASPPDHDDRREGVRRPPAREHRRPLLRSPVEGRGAPSRTPGWCCGIRLRPSLGLPASSPAKLVQLGR